MFRHLQKGRKIQYPYDQTAYLLTEQRFLNPSSKLKSFNNRAHSIIDHGQVDHLEDLYKVLDVLQEDKKTIVRHLNKEIQKRTKKGLSRLPLRCDHLTVLRAAVSLNTRISV